MFRISNLALLAVCLTLNSNSNSSTNYIANAFTSTSSPTRAFTVKQSNILAPAALFTPSPSSLQLSAVSDDTGASKSKLVRKPESAVELTITAPGAATKAAYDKACAEVSKTITIPGFRKGAKIPPTVLENAIASRQIGGTGSSKNALKTQAIGDLLNQLLEPALKEDHNLEPIGQPSLATSAEELAEKFVPGEPIEMVVQCDVWPDIQWKTVEGQEKPYFGLVGSYKRKPFNQARFEKAESDLAERYATNEPAPEGKELAMGDACVVNMEGYMAEEDGVTKGEPLPNAASGDNVEVILGDGRYMEGLVEGLVGAKVGETRQIYVTFPEGLRDKTLAGKKAIFDVTVEEASIRTVPEIDDELAAKIRPGLDAEGIRAELRKAIDENESGEWTEVRNKALSDALADVMDVEVPDTLVTNQAREKYAQMMAEFRTQGMDDDQIKNLITPENFLKYKDIEKADIVKDFKTSMATDEIARLESIEVPSYQIDEQLEAVKKEAAGEELGDENLLRSKIESTLMRRMVFDFLADHANLEVEYTEEEEFDEELMEKIAKETIEAQGGTTEDGKLEKEDGDEVPESGIESGTEENQSEATVNDDDIEAAAGVKTEGENEIKIEKESKEESPSSISSGASAEVTSREELIAEARKQPKSPEEEKALQEKYGAIMNLGERAFQILLDLWMIELTPDPDSPDYDHSEDDEIAPENIVLK